MLNMFFAGLLVTIAWMQDKSADGIKDKVDRREGVFEAELDQYYALRWQSFGDVAPPILASDEGLKIGMIGIVETNDQFSTHMAPLLIVKQVVSDTEAIVLVRSPRANGLMEFDALLKGPATQDFTPDTKVHIRSRLVKVTGAYRYVTVLGASRQIHQIEPTDFPIYQHPIQLGFGEIDWTNKTGDLIKKGASESFEKGRVRIINRDLKLSEVLLADLSDESKKTAQSLIREQTEKDRAEQLKKRQLERRQKRN
jgi:hypothetical protein